MNDFRILYMIRGKPGARNQVCFDMFALTPGERGLLRADRRPAVGLRQATLGNGYSPFVLRSGEY